MAKLVGKEFLRRFKGRVIIRTTNPMFDCVAKILEVKDSGPDVGLRVQIKKYLKGDWSKKEQFYHLREIVKVIPIGRDMKTIEVLFGHS